MIHINTDCAMKKLLFAIVALLLTTGAYAQDIKPLFGKCKTFRESSEMFTTAFGKTYDSQLKNFKKFHKEDFKDVMRFFKDERLFMEINIDGTVTMKEIMKDKLHPYQYEVIETTLRSMPKWTPGSQNGVLKRLGIATTLSHGWHKGN